MRQDIIDLYDAFTHGTMGRREFMKRLARIAGGAVAATALISVLQNDYARAETVSEDDDRLETFTATFDQEGPAVDAYAARPKGESILPAVIVIHENRGLNPHIKDVARRIALEGYYAFAVDMLSPLGGTPADEDKAREMIYTLDQEETVAKFAAITRELALVKTHQRKVGAVGFCWGGGMVNALAVASPHLVAGVSYYGRQVAAEDAAKIKASLMLHYAGEDARINAGIPDYEAALKAAEVDYQLFTYEGAQHAFNNDTNTARYNKEAADLAWSRTVAFFKEKLA